ncbi:hypothetical protein MMB17_18510 [Methylobacterium organophilum]|uniref:hypothetical protein n=1 Tax=Methylobacterium organophilum TaxID=410 RepID=UPI001F131348|nr:hypothetical protein [Methylobacterium organophilum]UMY16655.1 hypothetical protein MMB17_18510 [Methylobacterium organophilum]
MERSFEFKDEAGARFIAPRGWVGDLPDAVAKDAIDGKFAVDGNQRSATPVEQAGSGVQQDGQDGEGANDGLDDKTRPELEQLAAERGIDVSKAKTKADVIEALRAGK